MHTKDKLADELRKVGLNAMADKAAAGYYHDFLSPLPMPEIQLVTDLSTMAHDSQNRDAIMALRERVVMGEFDASAAESEEWFNGPEGQAALQDLVKGRKIDDKTD